MRRSLHHHRRQPRSRTSTPVQPPRSPMAPVGFASSVPGELLGPRSGAHLPRSCWGSAGARRPVVTTVSAGASRHSQRHLHQHGVPSTRRIRRASAPDACRSDSSNNVACQATDIRRGQHHHRQATTSPTSSPGTTYNYFITVTNPGSSTFLGDLTVTDDPPPNSLVCRPVVGSGAALRSIRSSAHSGSICSLARRPGDHDQGHARPNSLGNTVVNQATAIATVDPRLGRQRRCARKPHRSTGHRRDRTDDDDSVAL